MTDKKVIYRLKRKYPGLNKKIEIGDLFLRTYCRGVAKYERLSQSCDFLFDEYVNIYGDEVEDTEFWEKLNLIITLET